MASKGRRHFGNTRKLPSGRWQIRYPGPDGRLRPGETTYTTKTDALAALSAIETRLRSGEWTDPERTKIKLGEYADHWVTQRAGLRPRTVELYRWLLRKHIVPRIGDVALGRLSTANIREWRANLLNEGVSSSIAAKCYRLLRSILNTAVEEDGILSRNPCRVRGADKENPAERPVLTVSQVFELADRMSYERFRALILLASFCTLRWGEVTALRRCDIAEDGSWVRVQAAHTEVKGKGIVVGPPKSRAGVRTVSVPEAIRAEVVQHLENYVGPAGTSLVFTGPRGAALRRGNFNQLVKWTETVKKMGVAGLHFHDLRHTGNQFAARSGASTRELMARMGHDDMRAALIYQRATSEADARIADRVSGMVTEYREGQANENGDQDDDGTAGPVPVR